MSVSLSPAELIVVVIPEAAPTVFTPGPTARAIRVFTQLQADLEKSNAFLRPLFEYPMGRAPSMTFGPSRDFGPTEFFQVVAPEEDLKSLQAFVQEHEAVQAAFIKPPSTVPNINQMTASPSAPATQTANFQPKQGYLSPAPEGIDAMSAWQHPGGRGDGVNIIDLEWGWLFTHEDLIHNCRGLLRGTNHPQKDHGTAVLGEMGGNDNGFGITGICPAATIAAVSFNNVPNNIPSAKAIAYATSIAQPGDILLLEIHRPGPRFDFQERDDQKGYIAIEWWPDDFLAIRAAVAQGLFVVEAAGNGAENLDDPLYDTPDGFPQDWTNPFNRANRDSGAIIVGAGAPPSGNFGPDRSRLDFSNFGRCVDAQGWGREVVTTGYGDLQGGSNPDRFYSAEFSGTSSASPIVVGALACLQGYMRASGKLLTPNTARRILRVTGSPQPLPARNQSIERIGNRPDLKQAIEFVASGLLGGSEPAI